MESDGVNLVPDVRILIPLSPPLPPVSLFTLQRTSLRAQPPFAEEQTQTISACERSSLSSQVTRHPRCIELHYRSTFTHPCGRRETSWLVLKFENGEDVNDDAASNVAAQRQVEVFE